MRSSSILNSNIIIVFRHHRIDVIEINIRILIMKEFSTSKVDIFIN